MKVSALLSGILIIFGDTYYLLKMVCKNLRAKYISEQLNRAPFGFKVSSLKETEEKNFLYSVFPIKP